jgi:hypothetical protein
MSAMTGHHEGAGNFPARFAGDTAPFNSFDAVCGRAGRVGARKVPAKVGITRGLDVRHARAKSRASTTFFLDAGTP